MPPQKYSKNTDPQAKDQQRQLWLQRLADNLNASQERAHIAIAGTNYWSEQARKSQDMCSGLHTVSLQEAALEQANLAFAPLAQLTSQSDFGPHPRPKCFSFAVKESRPVLNTGTSFSALMSIMPKMPFWRSPM